jgi:phosphatidylserine/phosphatidylglycerophosphate/cardiolipin synthase-like enzyme
MSPTSVRRRQFSPWYLLLLLVVGLALGLYQAGCFGALGLGPAPAQVNAPAGTWVHAYFTNPGDGAQTGGVDEQVAADIATAQQSVDIASFEYDLESITQALLDAQQRGVPVRLVLDDGNLGSEEMARLTGELEDAGIPIVYDQRSAFMHDKFVIIDQKVLWVGSWNLTVNDTYRNNNNVLRFAVPDLAANYEAEFSEMFVDHQFGPRSPQNTPYPELLVRDDRGVESRIDTYFSPEDGARAAILEQLRLAQREIVFLAFSFTDEEMGRVLLEKARAGVQVRGVFEARNAEGEGSQYSLLKRAGLDIRLDGNPRTMHHKVLVIDGQVTITGSYNFSANAARDNDENVLVLSNTDLARLYLEEFDRVYQAGQE